jgi:6-pyruvoyltetrahydropterin/6-carboxytetrahydropterin synthase
MMKPMGKQNFVHRTRRIEISAAHSYVLDTLSEEERREVFGKSAITHAHGHDYDIRVTVGGAIDPKTGRLTCSEEIDALLDECLRRPLDCKHLNLEVPGLRNRWPTLESLAPFIWHEIEPRVSGCRLVEVQIYEDENFYIAYRGNKMVHLTRIYRFSAAHRLHNPDLSDEENLEIFGKCNNPHGHGHNYVLEITLSGNPDPKTDCLVDVGEMDATVREKILDPFDHVHLNLDTEEFRNTNPTAENMVKVFWGILGDCFSPARLHRLRLWKTSGCYFDYYGADGGEGSGTPVE